MVTHRRLVFALTVVVFFAVSATGAFADEVTGTTSLSVRLSYDADSCPDRVGVYLDHAADTISGFELVLMWDRPDVVRFRLVQTTVPPTRGERDGPPPDTVMAPVIRGDSGLVADWSYLEARGQGGHMARITGLGQLIDPNPASQIVPGDHGLLFELPLNVVAGRGEPAEGDSLTLEIQPQVSRLSNAQGDLITDVHLAPLRIPLPDCPRRD